MMTDKQKAYRSKLNPFREDHVFENIGKLNKRKLSLNQVTNPLAVGSVI